MKKLICLALVFIMLLSGCVKWNIEIVDPTKPVESESELVPSEREERHIKKIHSEKAETAEFSKDGFAKLRGSSIAFHVLKDSKALFFSYKEGDPFEGGGVAVKVFLYDYAENKTELIRVLNFGDRKDVSVFERDGKAKVVFANENSAEILSIDTESLETEMETLEDIPGNISSTGLWAFCGRHINIRDAENYNTLFSVIETEESLGFESWSNNSEYLLVRNEETDMIYSISGEKMAEIGFTDRTIWCEESNYFIYCKRDDDDFLRVWLLDILSGEKTEIEIDPYALLIEKDFAVIRVEEKLYIKEYSTGNLFEITGDFGEYNYYEEAVYDKENETIIAAAYKEGVTDVWKVSLEWANGAGEKSEQEINPDEQQETSGTENAEKTVPPISCERVVLQTNGGTIYKSLEFEDRIIIYYVGGSVAAFDIETGEKIHEFFIGNVNDNGAFDMIKADFEEGFDYCILTKSAIVYLSSENPELIMEVPLPKTVAKDVSSARLSPNYCVYGDKIAWQSEDGIKIMNTETGEAELLFHNDLIESVIIPSAEKAVPERTFYVDEAPYFFYNPKFICGGEKIVVSVTNERYVFWATALYNIEKEGFEWSYAYGEMLNADYPFADKFINIGGRRFINAENGNEILFEEFTRSFDGMNFFRIEYEDMDMHGFRAFIGDQTSIINGGTEIFSLTSLGATAYIDEIFENHLLVCVHEEGAVWDCLVKYK